MSVVLFWQVQHKMLSFKTALLLMPVLAKCVSEVYVLSGNLACMQFGMGDSKISIRPNLAFVPKLINPASSYKHIRLSSFRRRTA